MSVTSNENKQMLLELMSTIISDNKLIQPDNLREFIEEKCNYFHTRRFEFGSNNDINKKIVELCYNHIMATTRSHKTTTSPNTNTLTKREIFDKSLKVQTKNFNNMIQPKKPKEIDFTDGSKDFPMDNLGIIMNQTLADREKELNMITNQYTKSDKEKAQKWLNTKTEETDTPKIKIDRTSNVHINHENIGVRNRRVRFDIEEKSQSIGLEGFLSKLKKKPSKKTLEEKFDLIIENQNKILALLQKSTEEQVLSLEPI